MTLAIVDTNILVAGLLSADAQSPPVRIVDAMLSASLRFVLSAELLGEYRAVLARPRIVQRHGLDLGQIDLLLERLAENAVVRAPVASKRASPDPGDEHLWALLTAEPGAILITGDRLLLDACPWPDRVLSARRWLETWPEA